MTPPIAAALTRYDHEHTFARDVLSPEEAGRDTWASGERRVLIAGSGHRTSFDSRRSDGCGRKVEYSARLVRLVPDGR